MASDDGDPSVLVNRSLPKEPRLFAMVHELKHHYCDQKLLKNGQIRCGDYNANELIEKAAEVFAAEFIYPSREFLDCAESLGLKKGEVTPEEVVELRRACGAPISYKFLQKLPCVVWVYQPRRVCKGAVSEARREICGVPIYRQPWFKARRRRRGSTSQEWIPVDIWASGRHAAGRSVSKVLAAFLPTVAAF